MGICKFLLLFFVTVNIAWAESDTAYQAERIYREVLSPFCPGRSLQDCPSNAASDLKKQILSNLESGQSSEQVLDGLYKQYGDSIRAVPGFEGFGGLVWIMPVIFVFVGCLGLVFFLRKSVNSEEL